MAKQFELDHVFILTDVGAPGADKLVEFGLIQGPPTVHQGQPTVLNTILELLWVADAEKSMASEPHRQSMDFRPHLPFRLRWQPNT
ncbi:MAG: hypothetical protein AAF282_06945 [Cyanobacteria bacterium P01_A01_bin.15]